MFSHSDQAAQLASSSVCLIQKTLPPVRRTAAASLLTLGTISTADGTYATATSSLMKAFCRSTTISAVLAGVRFWCTCSLPRRASASSVAHCGISTLCMVHCLLQDLDDYTWCLRPRQLIGL